MAKKKSKVAKQKQKKAKSLTKKRKQISSKYNLPIHGSGSIKKAAMNTKTPYNSPKISNKQHDYAGAKPSGGIETLSSSGGKRKISRNFQVLPIDSNSDEQKDFMDEFKSLQERTLRQEQKQKEQKQKSGPMTFTQPIFDISKKTTTEELIIQATNQLNEQQFMNSSNNNNYQSMTNNNAMLDSLSGLNDGQNANPNTSNQNRNLLQEMAAKKREEMRMKTMYGVNSNNSSNAWNTNSSNDQNKMKENSFWALQENDSDEENENENDPCKGGTTPSAGGFFSFSAPSFIVPSTSTAYSKGGNSGFSHGVAIDDPDL